MKVSVVMAVWNRKKFVPETIESVLNQTYENFEFIIVDDGSTDGVTNLIREYEKKDNRIKFIIKEHSGGTDTFNQGFLNATGDAICVLGSDDVWMPTKLEKQVEETKKYPDCILHNNSESINENGHNICIEMFDDYTQQECRERALGTALPWFVTSSWFIPKKIFNKVGLFEGIYHDYHWMMKAVLLHNIWLKLIPEVLTKHRSNPDGNTFKNIGCNEFVRLGKEIQDEMIKILAERDTCDTQ